ncbi:Glyoxalase/Bleomycin resistance protein/Dioxygenase superfamily [Aspergillus violaceofuscus CBS 115571]|uniref:Glyoxalase/Bleomycin resistance protein/Dioxygenase superfamily n=1 Tax=Aspergillus violaceofuscus (strain CBS 115571) TaxID=1450538 RepID=A0A2V5IJQ8_ASPV1|nr:Glyoxalase/Bleomycin resistance protein/Dioxygenase superfamily [Aspergillus violaceofuscus CBS 115571]
MPPQPLLDHIVLLVSHPTLDSLPARLTETFHLAPGGTHADGLTTNKLILLQDGVYLELIAFVDGIDPETRRSHRWGTRPENTVIDWALTLDSGKEFGAVQRRVEGRRPVTGIAYTDPVAGGRVREGDGVRLEWEISSAVVSAVDGDEGKVGVGRLPFWCLDTTPRAWRVPYEDEGEGLTRHPSGVTGVTEVTVVVPEGERERLSEVYTAVLGEEEGSGSEALWGVDVPSEEARGRRKVRLVGSENAEEWGIRLALKGERVGSVELVPGLVVEIEE